MDSEIIRMGTAAIKRQFLAWKDPPLELPPDSVIDAVVIEVARISQTYSEVEPDGREDREGN